jgi:hypothetical protein
MSSDVRWIRVCRACGSATSGRYPTVAAAADVPVFWSADDLDPSFAPCGSCGSHAGYGVEEAEDPDEWDRLLAGGG